jgi:hypothetical protein
MTVAELIELLKTQPQELPVAYELYSDYALLETEAITVKELSVPRNDRWIESKRPDKPSQKYLVFPGN